MFVHLFLIIWGLLFGGVPLSLFISDPENAPAMIWLFIIIGMTVFGFGAVGLIRTLVVSALGQNTYGVILDVVPSGVTVNGIPQMNAVIGYLNGVVVEECETSMNNAQSRRSRPGKYVSIKVYNKRGKLIEIFRNDSMVSQDVIQKLQPYFQQHGNLIDNSFSNANGEAFYVDSNLNDADREFIGAKTHTTTRKQKSRICENCGAVIHTDECPYCGFIH